LKHPNFDYMKERLEDPSLLERAVPIVSGGIVMDLAVPVGGKRRGGYVVLPSMRACREAHRQLTGKPGFPNLRINKGTEECPHNVAWGGTEPEGDLERGRYFGYSERAVLSFVLQANA
jgi:Family of unknown function (DUF6302)